jgi:quinol monooxygenase YgiN
MVELFIIGRFHSRPGKEEAVIAALHKIAGPTRAEAGCRAYQQLRSSRDPGLFHIYSEWTDEAAFDRHAELPHTVEFLREVEPLLRHPLDITRARRLE